MTSLGQIALRTAGERAEDIVDYVIDHFGSSGIARRSPRELMIAAAASCLEKHDNYNNGFKAAMAKVTPAFRDLNVALQMIRDAVEELGPVAACSVSRDQFEPRPIDDAEAIIAGILKAIDWAKHEAPAEERAANKEIAQ